VQPPAPPPETPPQTNQKQRQKERVERPATSPEWTSKEVTRQAAVPSIGRIDDSSSVTLMLGGLALLALVICDTFFLTLSTREIRRAD
jgi:hypothetical protein